MSLRRILTTLAALSVLAFASCNTANNSGDQPEEKGTVGISILTSANPFFNVIADNLKATLEPAGYTVVVADAQEDPARQHNQVKDFIAQGCVAIVLTPKDAAAIGSAIREANEAGVPVFTCDTGCTDESAVVTGHVATDNYQGGRLAGEAMVEALGGHGEVAILHYFTTESCQERVRGFNDELAAQIEANPEYDITVVDTVEGEGKREVSETVTRDLLQTHPNIVGLFCINDPSALGAVSALEQANKLDDVTVIGFDGQRDGKEAILAGQIYADPIQFPDQMGVKTGENILAYFNGTVFEASELIPPALYYQEDAQQDPELQQAP